MAKAFFLTCVLGMTMSCSGTSSSSSSETSSEVIDSIEILQIDDKKNVIDVYDIGAIPAGTEVRDAVVIRNFDSEKGVRITAIDGDGIVSDCHQSYDSITPDMFISVDFKLKAPEEQGPFDATMLIHYKNIKNPTVIKIHGNAE